MTKCQITCKSLQKSSKCQNFLRVWHLVIFRADQSKNHPIYILVGIIQTWGMFYSDLKVLETGGDSGRMVTWYSLIWKVLLKRNWKSRNVVEKRRAGGKTQSVKIHTRGKSSFILNVSTWKTISVNPFDVIFLIGEKWIIAKTIICTSTHAWVEREG